jgi:hypothetical protein
MMKKILSAEESIDKMFEDLVQQLYELLPDFGKNLAIDSKAIDSFANRKNKNETTDGRRDTDADYGKKAYRGKKEDGTLWEKIVKWFGYKIHLVVDADYELPVSYKVTKASASDITEGHQLFEQIEQRQPDVLKIAETLSGDKGYDDGKFIEKMWKQHEMKSVIDIRNMWKDGEGTRLLEGHDNVAHDYKGTVYCYCPETGQRREMANGGFEKDRMTLKKGCPAKAYGITCEGQAQCPVAQGLHIPLQTDPRVFTAIDRSSYKWEKLYHKRTSVERVNSRFDVSFGFEKHTIRGKAKMKARCDYPICARHFVFVRIYDRVQQKHPEIRTAEQNVSLVQEGVPLRDQAIVLSFPFSSIIRLPELMQ